MTDTQQNPISEAKYEADNLTGEKAKQKKTAPSRNFAGEIYKQQAIVFLLLEIGSMIEYGLGCQFDTEVYPKQKTAAGTVNLAYLQAKIDKENPVRQYYPVYQDVHVMIFVGFGFLMVFLKRHTWSSIAFNFIVGAWTIQIGILWVGFWHCVFAGHWEKIRLNLVMLIEGDFAAGSVLISFGAILGKCNCYQVLIMSTFQIFFYGLNWSIGAVKFEAVDMGGSMFVHSFGAYFGLAVSAVITPKEATKNHPKMVGGYNSQLVAMVGTIFLWMFWPSFNGALATGNSQHRVIVNTVLALTASCMGGFLTSSLFHKGLFNMEDILNATISGGVIIGSSSDLVLESVWSILIGFLGGCISSWGYNRLSPWLWESCGLHDTCGVHNLHGVPGVLGGILGAISAAAIGDRAYGEDISVVFAARGKGRSASGQAQYQLATLGVTLALSLIGGMITGSIMKNFSQPEQVEDLFDDTVYWAECEPDEEDHKNK